MARRACFGPPRRGALTRAAKTGKMLLQMDGKAMKKKIVVFLLMISSSWFIRATDVEFPLIQSMSHFPYAHHSTLEKKDLRLTLDIFYSNIYTYDYERTRINDMETLSSTLGIRYGLTNGITLELYYRAVAAFGGIMDGLIINFHKTFGLAEGGRNDFPRDQVNYTYNDVFSYTDNTSAQLPLVLGTLARIYSSGNFHLNGRLALGIPLSSKTGFSSSKPFLTGGIILLYRKKNLSLEFSNHLSFFKNPNWLAEEDLRNQVFHSEIRLDYKRIFGGILYKSTPFKSDELSNDAYQVYLGIKIWKYFELSLVEEFPPMDTVPDVSFHLRVNLTRLLRL